MTKESQLHSIQKARALNRRYSKEEIQGLSDAWSLDCAYLVPAPSCWHIQSYHKVEGGRCVGEKRGRRLPRIGNYAKIRNQQLISFSSEMTPLYSLSFLRGQNAVMPAFSSVVIN